MSRTTATILFTDLVGSTEVRGRLGEEAADELRRRHDHLLAQAVEANNGSIVKGLGDGIMASFAGAADAVAAAVAIQQAIDRLNRSGKTPVPLSVRVGLSAGDVSFEDSDVHGTPVIEASRLCGFASGGETLASDLVRGLARATTGASFVELGILNLKGLDEPVTAVRVEWEPARLPAIPVPALLTDIGRIFVGRDAEVEQLLGFWKEASAGERRIVLLAGEPGVGKTRLAAEVVLRVHEEGGMILAGRCDEDLGVPYQPFVEALRHFADHTPAAELGRRLGRYGGELVRLLPELPGQTRDLPPPLRSDPETERYRLFDAVAAWLSAAAAEDPVLLLLDDLQWAAKPTLLLLRHVARSPEAKRLFILGTYRDVELTHDHALIELVADLRRESAVERLSVGGLDDLAVAAMVERAAGHVLDDGGRAFAQAVFEETEGNPFFVREVLRHLAETKAIERHDDRWVAAPLDRLGIPEGARDVIGRRLARLSRHANDVLGVAAVVGAEFEVTVLQGACQLAENDLLGALDEAIGARLVSEVSPTRLRFSHALVRATLYESLSGTRKAALHRHVAESIENVHRGSLDDHLPALARHWAMATVASDPAQAVAYARKAGDRALAQLAHDEAAGYYSQALELLDAGGLSDEEERTGLLIALGEAQRRAGDPAHRDTLLEAARLAEGRGDAEALARAALANIRGMYSSVVGGVDVERVAALEAALEAVGGDDTPIRARLLAALASEIAYSGDPARRVALADEALAVARRTGDDATLARVLLQRFFASNPFEVLDELVASTEELLALAERLDDPVVKAQALWLRGRVLGQAGDMEGASRHLEAAERLIEELGQPTLRWLVGTTATTRTIFAGDLEAGEHKAVAGSEVGQATGQRDAANFLAMHLFLIRLEQDRAGELEEQLSAVVAALPGQLSIRAILAQLLCEIDRADQAVEHYQLLAADNFANLPRNPAWLVGMAHCAAVAARLGDGVGAQVLFDLLVPYARQIIFTNAGAIGAVAHHLAVLAATFGDFDEAERRFSAAAAAHERVRAPIWLARTRLEWARMLLRRGQADDAPRAGALLEEALNTARQLGATNIGRQAVALLGSS